MNLSRLNCRFQTQGFAHTHTGRHTHLGEVVDEGEVSLLQLGSGQRRQRVGVVQLFAVVRWQQVWVQADHMGRICVGGKDIERE